MATHFKREKNAAACLTIQLVFLLHPLLAFACVTCREHSVGFDWSDKHFSRWSLIWRGHKVHEHFVAAVFLLSVCPSSHHDICGVFLQRTRFKAHHQLIIKIIERVTFQFRCITKYNQKSISQVLYVFAHAPKNTNNPSHNRVAFPSSCFPLEGSSTTCQTRFVLGSL